MSRLYSTRRHDDTINIEFSEFVLSRGGDGSVEDIRGVCKDDIPMLSVVSVVEEEFIPYTALHNFIPFGIAVDSGAYNESIRVRTNGVIRFPNMELIKGLPVFIHPNGTLTQVEPKQGKVFRLGMVINNDKEVYIDIMDVTKWMRNEW